MVEADTMISTAAGTARTVFPKIRSLAGVLQANIVAGEFDIIAYVEADSPQALLALVTDGIQSIEGVGRTRTSVVLK